MELMIASCIGAVIGTIVTRLFIGGNIIGTLHIEQDLENGGEQYRFSFDSFDEARKSKIVRFKIEDHTH